LADVAGDRCVVATIGAGARHPRRPAIA